MQAVSLEQPGRLGWMAEDVPGLPGEFDYTFTDRELFDILDFMEKQQADGTPAPPPGLPFLASAVPPNVGLQFQPHPPQHTAPSLLPSESLSYQPSGGEAGSYVKQEGVSCVTTGPARSMPAAANGCAGGGHRAAGGGAPTKPGTRSQAAAAVGLADVPASPGSSGDAGPTGGGGGFHGGALHQTASSTHAAKKDGKSHLSHSTVEKQRRDRINSLIDELRDLVPPQSANSSAQEGLDSKRPKHVVLSDTIALVKDLQVKASLGDRARSYKSEGDLGTSSARDLLMQTLPEGRRSTRSSSLHAPSGSPPELPSAPEGAPVSSGVVVEEGEGCLYVKVNCKDRRGLLSDIIAALKSMPLEVTTAAVATTPDGNVYDVFQVKVDREAATTAQDIQCHVHAQLYAHAGDKRRRKSADGVA